VEFTFTPGRPIGPCEPGKPWRRRKCIQKQKCGFCSNIFGFIGQNLSEDGCVPVCLGFPVDLEVQVRQRVPAKWGWGWVIHHFVRW